MSVVPILLLLASTAEVRGDGEAIFRRGLEQFEVATRYRDEHPADRSGIAQRFRASAETFTRCALEGPVSSRAFVNAANSWWFAGDTGRAVLFYRRAVAADPGCASARGALEHLREELPIHPSARAARTLADTLLFWHDERSFQWRVWLFWFLFPAAWLLFGVEIARAHWPAARWFLLPILPLALLAFALSYLFRLSRPYATVGLLAMLPALVLLGSLVADALHPRAGREAVVIAEVTGRRGDGESYSPSHTRPFPAGTEVEIAERRSHGAREWLRVRLLDGTESWLPARSVEAVVPAAIPAAIPAVKAPRPTPSSPESR